MTIELKMHDGRVVPGRRPHVDARYILIDGHQCECSQDETLEVAGGTPTRDGDRVTAPGGCVRCHGSVGTIIVTEETLFGREEDRAVLGGMPRVY
jgi:hypothetical protein